MLFKIKKVLSISLIALGVVFVVSDIYAQGDNRRSGTDRGGASEERAAGRTSTRSGRRTDPRGAIITRGGGTGYRSGGGDSGSSGGSGAGGSSGGAGTQNSGGTGTQSSDGEVLEVLDDQAYAAAWGRYMDRYKEWCESNVLEVKDKELRGRIKPDKSPDAEKDAITPLFERAKLERKLYTPLCELPVLYMCPSFLESNLGKIAVGGLAVTTGTIIYNSYKKALRKYDDRLLAGSRSKYDNLVSTFDDYERECLALNPDDNSDKDSISPFGGENETAKKCLGYVNTLYMTKIEGETKTGGDMLSLFDYADNYSGVNQTLGGLGRKLKAMKQKYKGTGYISSDTTGDSEYGALAAKHAKVREVEDITTDTLKGGGLLTSIISYGLYFGPKVFGEEETYRDRYIIEGAEVKCNNDSMGGDPHPGCIKKCYYIDEYGVPTAVKEGESFELGEYFVPQPRKDDFMVEVVQ